RESGCPPTTIGPVIGAIGEAVVAGGVTSPLFAPGESLSRVSNTATVIATTATAVTTPAASLAPTPEEVAASQRRARAVGRESARHRAAASSRVATPSLP